MDSSLESLIGSRVTALKPTRRDPSRLSIMVGRRHVVTLDGVRVVQLGVQRDTLLDAALVGQLAAVVELDHAHRDALSMLERRAYSSGELADRLAYRKGYDQQVVDEVVAELNRSGLLDDYAYGQALIRQVTGRRAAGERLLRQKLYQKRLPRPLIDRLIQEHVEQSDAASEIAGLLARELAKPSVQAMAEDKRRRRLIGLLQRRGYDLSVIIAQVNRILEADHA